MFELLGQDTSSSTSLLKSVLAVAPHLADDEDSVFKDPYLGETQKCRMVYASQKPFKNLVIKAQGQKVLEPVANSIWRLVILDKYIDFEKLYATLDPGYNPNDEAEELNEKFTLLEKGSIGSKRSVTTEAEWMCLYDVWAGAVLQFYPHRKDELSSFRDLIINIFQATSSPLPAIKYDCDSREDTPTNLIASIAVRTCFHSLCSLSCSLMSCRLLPRLWERRDGPRVPKSSLVNKLKQSVKTGIWAIATVTRAILATATMSAASVVSITKLKTGASATLPSIANANSKEQQQLERAAHKAQDAQAAGTRQLKRKTADSISEIPRYKWGYVWEKSSSPHSPPPSTLATETAPPCYNTLFTFTFTLNT